MQLLKKIGLALFLAFLVLCAVSFFIPSGVFVERSAYIKAPVDSLYNKVNNLRSWSEWSPWYLEKPETKTTFSGSGRGVGSAMQWTNENTAYDNGRVEITSVNHNKEIKTVLFLEDNGYGFSDFHFSENDTTALVTWKYSQNIPWYDFFGKYKGLIKETLVGDKMYRGLTQLNNLMDRRSKN